MVRHGVDVPIGVIATTKKGREKKMNRVHAYGGCQLLSGETFVDEQMYRGKMYYNDLVRIEWHRRKEIHKEQEKIIPGMKELNKEIRLLKEQKSELEAQQKKSKSHDGKTAPIDEELLNTVTDTLAAAFEKSKKLKSEYKDDLKPVYEKLDAQAKKSNLYIRSTSGLYWGTYQVIEASVKQAIQDTIAVKTPEPGKKTRDWEKMPDLRDDHSNGVVAVQIQNGRIPTSKIFNPNDTQVWIDPLPENAFDPSVPRGQRNKMQRTTLHMRVCSEGRNPVWASWPLFLHRPLPKDGKVTGVTVIRSEWRQGFRYRWKVLIAVDVPDPEPKPINENSMVAINLGWRKLDNGDLRVATWMDTKGQGGELTLGPAFRDRVEKAESLRGFRDKDQDELKAKLVALGVPCEKWESPDKFKSLLDSNDATILNLVEAWVKRDDHLWWYERGVRSGSLNYRKEVYRLWALSLAKKYDIIVIDSTNYKKLAKKDKDQENETREYNAQRVESAPSISRDILRNAATRLGCRILEGDEFKATQECAICGCKDPWDAAPRIKHHCKSCNNTWDQDENNCKNLLARGKKALKTLGALAGVKKKRPPRFAKRHKPKPQDSATV